VVDVRWSSVELSRRYITSLYLYRASVCLRHVCKYTVDLSDEYIKCSRVEISRRYAASIYLYRASVYLKHLCTYTVE